MQRKKKKNIYIYIYIVQEMFTGKSKIVLDSKGASYIRR